MNQARVYLEADKPIIEALEPSLEADFEEDGYPVASFEIDEDTGLWGLSVYVPQEETEEAVGRLERVAAAMGYRLSAASEILEPTNWVARTLEQLAPVRAGRFVVHGSHDAGCARPNEHAIRIDAGMAFGTGHHGTTAGCLAMIDKVLKYTKPQNALDLGSGSGVLAIAVAKACRVPVLATDIDPVAAEIARRNAIENGVGAFVQSITATGFNHRRFIDYVPFDLIIANILAGPLQAMAHALSQHASPGGTVILSGLLPHQKARILAAYRAQGLAFQHVHYQNGWMTLILRNMR